MAGDPNRESNKPKSSVDLQNSDELQQVFDQFDFDNDGKISVIELGYVLQALGTTVSPNVLGPVVEDLDSDRDGLISFPEFAAFWRSGYKDGGAMDLRDAFNLYDQDHNGLISCLELCFLLNHLGMIRSVDFDSNGNVNFEGFKKMMTNRKRKRQAMESSQEDAPARKKRKIN